MAVFGLVIARMKLALDQIQTANAEREVARLALAHQAAHDSLTGLPNRAQAMLLMRGALSRAQRSGAVVGLLFVDLDGFKQVNDTLGHAAGDEVLVTASRRMQACVRSGDVVARFGGDEFVVLLEPLDEQASAVAVAERLVAALAEPVLLASGREVGIGASVGVALAQDGTVDPGARPDGGRRRGLPREGRRAGAAPRSSTPRCARSWTVATGCRTASPAPSRRATSSCATSRSSTCAPVASPATRPR